MVCGKCNMVCGKCNKLHESPYNLYLIYVTKGNQVAF